MKSLKSSWKICLAAFVGFLFGVVVLHIPTAKAQYGGSVTVQEVIPLTIRSTMRTEGSQVVGFSCVSKDGEPECYIASK